LPSHSTNRENELQNAQVASSKTIATTHFPRSAFLNRTENADLAMRANQSPSPSTPNLHSPESANLNKI
jgi:hypothetical protein